MKKTVATKAFAGTADFQALFAAEAFLKSIGASCGQNQRGEPTGILFGEFHISKWRNMNVAERAALHGVIDAGDHRAGPVVVRFFDTTPRDCLAKLNPAFA